MKDQLIFDTTSATTISDSDSVGAYVRSDDGTLITHHTVGADEGLDVYLINSSIEVTATDLDIRDLSHLQDSVLIGDGTEFLAINADGSINITDNGGSITVDAVDLDIRDLTAATDSVASWTHDGTGTAITSTVVGADTALDVNVVGGVNVEVDLSHIDDSVRLGDGTNFFTSTTIGSDIGLDVNVINDPSRGNSTMAHAAETLDVANTAQNIIVSPLSDRKYVWIYNSDNQKMFIGGTGVTSATGFPISPGSYMELRAGAAVDIEYVSSKVSHEIRTLELS